MSSDIISSKVCMKKDVGLNGNLFGGNMMAWMDEISFIYADKVTKGRYFMVTKKFGEIVFKIPVKEGNVVDFYCENCKVGNTSVSFDVKAMVNDRVVFETSAIFVALDCNGNKTKIEEINVSYIDK